MGRSRRISIYEHLEIRMICSPSPRPYPLGEGECFGSAAKGHCFVNFSSAVATMFPLLGERAGVRGTATLEYPKLFRGSGQLLKN